MNSVLVVGVAVLDFVFQMAEFPRTAEKYRADGASISGGGNAANSSVAIARLGGTAHLAARLGDDQIADLILTGLAAEGVDTQLTRRFPNKRSSFSSIYIDGQGERQIMNFRDNTLSMNADWLREAVPESIGATLGDTRWPNGARAAMQIARERGVAGIIDAESPVHEAEEALLLASHVAFSAQGASDYTGETDFRNAAKAADQKLPGTVLVTDGANGVVMVKDGELSHFPAFDSEVVDTLGAGDVWHGVFAWAMAHGRNEIDAIRLSSAAAALKCSRPGGRDGAPSLKEVHLFIEERS